MIIFHSSGGWKVQDEGASRFIVMRAWFLVHRHVMDLTRVLLHLFFKGPNPILEGFTFDLITSPRPYLLILLHEHLAFHHMNLERWAHNHSARNSNN